MLGSIQPPEQIRLDEFESVSGEKVFVSTIFIHQQQMYETIGGWSADSSKYTIPQKSATTQLALSTHREYAEKMYNETIEPATY